MGVRFPSVQSKTLVNANVGINVETVVVTTPPFTPPLDSALIFLFWYMIHTIGTTAATVTYVLRRGTTTGGVIVNTATAQTGVAGQVVSASGCYFDSPGAVGSLQYSLNCQDNASTVAGAIADACLLVFAL